MYFSVPNIALLFHPGAHFSYVWVPAVGCREAIQLMGDLGVEYGFYGSEWDSLDLMTYEEVCKSTIWDCLEFVVE